MKNHFFLLCASMVLAFTTLSVSCKKDATEPTPQNPTQDPPSYTVPTTYDFGANTNLKSSLQRLAMLKELVNYVRTTHNSTTNISISSTIMRNMYSNSNSPFVDASALGLNTSGINLKDRTNDTYSLISQFDALFDEAAATSQSTVSGSNGVAGKVLGLAPTSSTAVQPAYLLNANGFEYKELLEKGAMAGIFYFQATTLLKNIASFENSNVIQGQGTAMEHAWDEAFGYFGVPVSFPTSTVGISYWGSYCNSVNAAIGSNTIIMNAWLKGRAAITNKDSVGRDAARDLVLRTWEKIGAARLITYLKQAKTNFANDGARNHNLSEGVGFIRAFKYNPLKKITDAEINELLSYLGNNLYEVTLSNIDNCITKVAAIYELDANKL